MDLLDDFSADLMSSIGMNADSVFGELPDVPGQQPQQPAQEDTTGMATEPVWDQPQVTPPPTGKDGTQWVPGVGFVKKNSGNAAQQWEAAAGSPAPNLAAIQAHNAQLLDPSQSEQGGPGRAPSTQRYYTRKLAREMLQQKGLNPEARQSARMALRFNGADSSQSGAQGLTNSATWNSLFSRNENNNFGEGTGEHTKDSLVNEPGGGSRFRYLTDIS